MTGRIGLITLSQLDFCLIITSKLIWKEAIVSHCHYLSHLIKLQINNLVPILRTLMMSVLIQLRLQVKLKILRPVKLPKSFNLKSEKKLQISRSTILSLISLFHHKIKKFSMTQVSHTILESHKISKTKQFPLKLTFRMRVKILFIMRLTMMMNLSQRYYPVQVDTLLEREIQQTIQLRLFYLMMMRMIHRLILTDFGQIFIKTHYHKTK